MPTQDGAADSGRVAVLGFELWQRRFGSNPQIVDSKIMLDDKPYTVVGIMPPGFHFFVKQGSFSQKIPEIWVAMKFTPDDRAHPLRQPVGGRIRWCCSASCSGRDLWNCLV